MSSFYTSFSAIFETVCRVASEVIVKLIKKQMPSNFVSRNRRLSPEQSSH